MYLGYSSILSELSRLFFCGSRKVFRSIFRQSPLVDENGELLQCMDYVQLFNDEANLFVRDLLCKNKPCMIAKFGSVELSFLVSRLMRDKNHYSLSEIKDFYRGIIPSLNWSSDISSLCTNAGYFPVTDMLAQDFFDEYFWAIKQIDILGSYLPSEKYFDEFLGGAIRINLEGYYSPFYYCNPWTECLEGKKVLVIHPFIDDIASQYARREKIWSNPHVLPEFGELKLYKPVQSFLGMKTKYQKWIDALQQMKNDIAKIDFDIALIGCGAYGMPLAAFCKSIGKQAVHLAGWTQILFGIVGQRWEKIPRVASYMNEYWVHPSPTNRPVNAEQIEHACYW